MDIVSYLLGKNSSSGGGGGLDWSLLGYENTPESIIDGYNYALNIKNNWDSSVTSFSYEGDNNLVYFPLVDTSNVTSMISTFSRIPTLAYIPELDTSNVISMIQTFYGSSGLKYIPLLNTSKVTTFTDVFSNNPNLNDESLDNILQMCINATSYNGTKTLSQIGLNRYNYPASRIQALPHYEDFINAGWTIGYN